MPGRFVDSNILLYLVLDNGGKAAKVREVLGLGCTISVQVLNETTNVLRRKYKMPWDEVRRFLSVVRDLTETVPTDVAIHEVGIDIAERYGFSIYDSMILAAAMKSDCQIVFSEDMQHGQIIDRQIRIINPFA
jgi:predicted nucleic acid-binding protein